MNDDDRVDGEIEAVECALGFLSLLCLLMIAASFWAWAWFGLKVLQWMVGGAL